MSETKAAAPPAHDPQMVYVEAGDINAVLRLVTALADTGDMQLGILAYAFAVGCKSCNVTPDRALYLLQKAMEKDAPLEPLQQKQGLN